MTFEFLDRWSDFGDRLGWTEDVIGTLDQRDFDLEAALSRVQSQARGATVLCTSTTRPFAPFAGQQIYETDTGSSLTWNGFAWRRPWNMPWGHVYSHVRTTNSPPGVGAPDAHTFTAVANRRYKLTISGALTSTLATFVQVGFADVAANPFRTTWVRVETAGASFTFSGSYVETFAAGSVTLQSYVVAIAGNASFTSNAMVPVQVIIEDIGPSGSPA